MPLLKKGISLIMLFTFGLAADSFTKDKEKEYNIVAIGDSITEGGNAFFSYRCFLSDKLSEAGYHVNFVGSRNRSCHNGKTLRHEGYSGKNAEFLADTLKSNFKKYPFDILLIHAGHNHFDYEKPIQGIITATENIIRSAREINPRVIILLATVIEAGKLPKYSYIPELNLEIPKIANRLLVRRSPIIIVDQAKGFNWKTDAITDFVHPNEIGAKKMAEKWFSALTEILEKPNK
ncbi:MAG: GDSL-type esterase/lipase family protein [Rikenellaceae bacterium]